MVSINLILIMFIKKLYEFKIFPYSYSFSHAKAYIFTNVSFMDWLSIYKTPIDCFFPGRTLMAIKAEINIIENATKYIGVYPKFS